MTDKPVISTNWLLNERDQDMAVQAYRRTREIWSHFDPSVIIGPEAALGGNVTSYGESLEYVKTKGISAIHHATSLVRLSIFILWKMEKVLIMIGMMGRANNSMAAVDSRDKVFGVQELRAIDSSSFAFTSPGHRQGATCKILRHLAQYGKLTKIF
jgi:choline dehydrogenase